MKAKILLGLVIGFTSISGIAQTTTTNANTPSMVIGGIEVNNISGEKLESVLRLVIYENLVTSKKYVVNDRYDVAEKLGADKVSKCLGKDCLIKVGKELNSDFAMSASYDGLGDRILISMKIVNVNSGEIVQNEIEQFENQPRELNRMTDIMLDKLTSGTMVETVASRALVFKDGPASSTGLGKMNNNGPRIGFAFATGANGDYFYRGENDGGIGTHPLLFNFGYQLEKQYAGTENFSGLFEFIGNISGLEQGSPIPSLAILHGVRFGKGAWEFALGPSITAKKLYTGTKDYDGTFRSYSDLANSGVMNAETFQYTTRPDTRGATYLGSNFVIGLGKTFRPGSLNVPLNLYASINKYGTTYGLSMGINITRSRKYTTTH